MATSARGTWDAGPPRTFAGRRPGGWHTLGNYLKTAVLLAALSALALVVGDRLGGPQGLLLAGAFVLLMNFGTYWFSDRIVLAMHRARPISRDEMPWLYEMVERIARRAGMPPPKLYILDVPTPNAFATGRNPRHAAVAVTTGILQLLDRRELEAVLAHELAHVRNRDTLISTVAATLAGIISYAAQMLFWFGGSLLAQGRDDEDDGIASMVANLGLVLVAPIAATLLQLAVSRSREFGADATGAQLSGDPQALASALMKLDQGVHAFPYNRAPGTAHLFIVNPLAGGAVRTLFSTHPPIPERVRRLQAMAYGGAR